MRIKAEDENTRARTLVRNRAFSNLTTLSIAHTGEKDRGKLELKETQDKGILDLSAIHQLVPFLTILVKISD